MEHRCKIILQNYFKTHEYIHNTDYKIIKGTNNWFAIYYKNNLLFSIINKNNYHKYNICNNKMKKQYDHNKCLFYINNKNNEIKFYKADKIKIIFNTNTNLWKYYNKYYKIYKMGKMGKMYYFMYYYSYFYIFCLKNKYENIIINKLYSNNYSIMFLFFFVLIYN